MCPMVPMFTCGLLRSNFSFAMVPLCCQRSAFCLLLSAFCFLLSAFCFLNLPSHFPLNLRHYLLRDILRNFLVLPKVHRKGTAALRAGSQLGSVSEHLRQRHHGLDHLSSTVNFGAFQPSAPRVYITIHSAHVLIRHHHFHAHHRLQKHRLGSFTRFLHARGGPRLRGHFGRIHFVICAVEKRHLDVHDGIAGQNAAFHRFPDALFHRGDKFPGHGATVDFVLELEALSRSEEA